MMFHTPEIEEFLGSILQWVPEYRLTYDESVSEHGELLPIVMMNDLARVALSDARNQIRGSAGRISPYGVMGRTLTFLESLTQPSESVEQLIMEFCESLAAEWRDGDLFQGLYEALGPRLRSRLEQFFPSGIPRQR